MPIMEKQKVVEETIKGRIRQVETWKENAAELQSALEVFFPF